MEQLDIIALSHMKGMTPAFLKKNWQGLVSATSAEDFLERIQYVQKDTLNANRDLAARIIQKCAHLGVQIIDVSMPSYPAMLKDIGTPPSVLYTLGDVSLLDRVVGIIGTRHSTNLGNKIAQRIGEYFSEHLSVCNGLVEGIDEHVFRREGQITKNVVGVASGGLDYGNTCSTSHAHNIAEALDAGGLVVSEFDPDQKEDRFSGIKASRIQAGLSMGLILVQSSVDGGSKYTISEFSRLGRILGVVQYKDAQEYGTDVFGANRLILEEKEHGLAKLAGKQTTNSVSVKEIIPISGKSDYDRFLKALGGNHNGDKGLEEQMLTIF